MRAFERLLSLLLAVAVVVGSLLLAVEVVWAALGKSPLLIQWQSTYDRGGTDAWDSAPVRTAAVVLLVVGLLLLLAELKPRRTPRLQLTGTDPSFDAAVTRRSLRSALLNAAKQVDGISGAKARVSGRRARVTATSRLGSVETAQSLTSELEAALRERLDSLQLARTPRLRARVTPRRHSRSA